MLPLPTPPDALADRIPSTLPSIVEFHRDLGLHDSDAIQRGGSAFRLGTLFDGWAGERPAYVHAYDRYGQPFGTNSFHTHWIRAARLGATAPFDAYSPGAAMARANSFALPDDDAASPFGHFEYGLALDIPRYTQMLRSYALHLGVAERSAGLADVAIRSEDGFIEALALDDGSRLAGDLFVDCSGPQALLRGKMDAAFEDWGAWLPCDRIMLTDGMAAAEPAPLDRAAAHGAGWRWVAQGRARTSHGFVYASAEMSDDKAARALRGFATADPGLAMALRQGRRPQPWLRNCVAIGDAATVVEPLEWTNLHLAHSAIDRLVAMMPDRDCAAVELWDFNRQCAAEADRVRDFLALHYAIGLRDEPFWRRARGTPPPRSLAHTLALFGERGRLPFYEEETFSRDSWLAILLGQGQLPRRTDPLVEIEPQERSALMMAEMRGKIATVVARQPSHAAFLKSLTQRAQP